LGFEILAAIICAEFIFLIYRAAKTKTMGAARVVKFQIPMIIAMAIGILFGFLSPHLLHPTPTESGYIGQASFPFGDLIEITSVVRTRDRLMAKGHYHLVSAGSARLALYITTTNHIGVPTDSRQEMQIVKGHGEFELVDTHLVPGLPHVTMYSQDGQPFAGVYFGNQAEAQAESNLDLHYGLKSSGPALEQNGMDRASQTSPASQNPQATAARLTEEGWQLWQSRKLIEAAAKFNEAVQLAPSNANAWNGLGWATFNSGKYDDAEAAFQRAVSIETNHPAALNGLGQIYLSQRKYDNAEKFLLKAAPRAPAAWYGLVRLYLLEGKFEQAETWAQKLVDSGQADETGKKMLEAAKAKHLSEGLRFVIEPPETKTNSGN
jgi:Flp pilus assembly protein TadD